MRSSTPTCAFESYHADAAVPLSPTDTSRPERAPVRAPRPHVPQGEGLIPGTVRRLVIRPSAGGRRPLVLVGGGAAEPHVPGGAVGGVGGAGRDPVTVAVRVVAEVG